MDWMQMNLPGLMPEFLLAGGGLLLLLVGAFSRAESQLPRLVALLITLVALGVSLHPLGSGGPAMAGSASLDALSTAARLVVLIVLLMLQVAADGAIRRRHLPQTEYHGLSLFAAAGMLALASAGDLVTLFLGIEVLSLALYGMAGLLAGRLSGREAAIKYFITGSFASALLLFGMALLFAASGTLRFAGLSQGLAQSGMDPAAAGGLVLVLAGLLFKVGAVPFHQWVPDVYQGSSAPVTAFMSTAAKAAAFAGFGRLLIAGLEGQQAWWMLLLAVAAALTMVVGNLIALPQDNVKRMLGWSAVAHAGYLTLGLTVATGEGLQAVLFYLLPYALANVSLFLLAAEVTREGGGSYHIEEVRGLGRRHPWVAVLLTVFLLSLAGIPPLAGFLGKFWLFSSAVELRYTGLAVLGILASVLSVYYYLRVVVFAWFRDSEQEIQTLPFDRGLLVTASLAGIALLVLGIWPGLWLELCGSITL